LEFLECLAGKREKKKKYRSKKEGTKEEREGKNMK